MDAVLRLIDANANRAREALRVMEDLARFVLNRGDLSAHAKAIRHELRTVLESAGLDPVMLSAWRDTPGDVGVGIKESTEGRRPDHRAIGIAAGKRAGEALRSLEEGLKTAGLGAPGGWARCEGLRYRLYELERQLILALGVGGARQWRLCVLLTESLCRLPWLEVARACFAAGVNCLQLREPTLEDGRLLERAISLLRLLDERALWETGTRPSLVINNRVDVALIAGADGVHLGTGDLPISAARKLCGSRLFIGASTHTLAEARAAAAAGADYCGVGAMFSSMTKAREPSGPDYLSDYLSDATLARLPHLAIGGITMDNAPLLVQRGAKGLAVSSVVCGAADPGGVCERLISTITGPG